MNAGQISAESTQRREADGHNAPFGLRGKRALITGGARGIGRSICLALADEGVDMVIADRLDATEVVNLVRDRGTTAHQLAVDLAQADQAENLCADATAVLGGLDLFVNVAADAQHEPITQITAEGWQRTLATNLSACVWASHSVARWMIDHGGGAILIIGSTAVHHPFYWESAYRASKAGLRAFMEVLAIELAPFSIRVNMLTPGATATALLEKAPHAVRSRLAADIPIGRIANPTEIAPSALFLLSDTLSPYTTGTELIVDGGVHLRPHPLSPDAVRQGNQR